MAELVRMPKMSDTMTEGAIAKWHKKVGDVVKSGELMAEIETDKATMDYESFSSGTLLYLGGKEGDKIKVDDVLAIVGKPGEDFTSLLTSSKTSDETKPPSDTATAAPAGPSKPLEQEPSPTLSPSHPVATPSDTTQRIKASPLARKMIQQLGYSLTDIPGGTGDHGRIIKRDVERYQSETVKTPQPYDTYIGKESYKEIPVSQMRKTIASRLSQSKFTSPHFYLTIQINMDRAIEARAQINEMSPEKISFNDIIVKATAAALRHHPNINVSWKGEHMREYHHIHIGVAVSIPDGLVVPVIRFADHKSLSQISSEIKTLVEKANNKKLQPADWEGGTFTISNLGMFGIDEFTAIINPPEACILAVSGITETVIVRNAQPTVGHVMKVTLSCDHRIVDGVAGAHFLQTLKKLLESPVRILL